MLLTVVLAAVAAVVVLVALTLGRRAPVVPRSHHDSGKTRIVVLGGGFAGVYACAELEKLQRDDYEIVLVNKENHFVFQPLLPEVISGQIGLVDVVSPI